MVNFSFSLRARILLKVFGNVNTNKLFPSLNIDTKSQSAEMDSSLETIKSKPVLSVDTAIAVASELSLASTPPVSFQRKDETINTKSPKSSNLSINHKCNLHSVVPSPEAHHEQDQLKYTNGHPAVLEFTKAYLKEAFDVESTKALLADQKDKASSSLTTPTESRKWWKRSKSEPKTPASCSSNEHTGTTAFATTSPDSGSPNRQYLPIERITHAELEALLAAQRIQNADIATPSAEYSSGLKFTGDSSLLGQDSSSKGKGKDTGTKKSEKDNSQPRAEEDSYRGGEGSASKGKGGKKKSKRSKGKGTQVKTAAENTEVLKDTTNDDKGKAKESSGPSKTNAQQEKEKFVAFKVYFQRSFFGLLVNV